MDTGLHARLVLHRPEFSLDVNLTLPGHGVSAIFGASGSGKTSLLRCIAGLERATGALSINGEIWQDANRFVPSHRRAVGYVFQEPSLFPHLSVRGNLEYARQRNPRASDTSLDFTLALLGITDLIERKPNSLSGGERQRVAIARALLSGPRLLLLDEPLAALDQLRKQEILPYLERLHTELKIPVLYVSHASDEVARLADHLVVLSGGKALASGPLTETLARLDLPSSQGDDAGVVLSGHIAGQDADWHLARVRCGDAEFYVRDDGHPVGHPVRLRILARDVSITRSRAIESSILNIVPAEIVEIIAEAHPAQSMIKLKLGAFPLLARLTRRSVDALQLTPGEPVFAQIKAVALLA